MIPKGIQEKLLPIYLKLNAGSAPPVSKEEREEEEHLRETFVQEIEALEALFPETDFSIWKEERARPV